MGRVKRRIRSVLLILTVVSAAAWMSGCGVGSDTRKEQIPPKENSSGNKREMTENQDDEAGEIPGELFPGQRTTAKGDGQDNPSSEETFDASDGGIASEENPDAGDTSGGGSPEAAGSGQDGGKEKESEQETGQAESSQIQVCVRVESSAVGNIVSYDDTVTLNRGATAYDALAALCGGQIAGSSSYVTGIGGLSEKDYGPKSGWIYSVNGTNPNKGSGSYTLHDGDVVVWSYVM